MEKNKEAEKRRNEVRDQIKKIASKPKITLENKMFVAKVKFMNKEFVTRAGDLSMLSNFLYDQMWAHYSRQPNKTIRELRYDN